MVENDDKESIVIRRKIKVTSNKSIYLPIDVIEAWGGLVPQSVIFTVTKVDSRLVVTIDPVVEQATPVSTIATT